MIENTAVQAERARIQQQYADGLQDGYDNFVKPLPHWYETKPLIMLTAYERGYFIGRELAGEENEDV